MTSDTTGRRRAVVIDLLIATVAIAIGAWVSTWSVKAVVVLAVVVAIVMAIRFKRFTS